MKGTPQPEPLVAILFTLVGMANFHRTGLGRRGMVCTDQAAMTLALWSLTGSWS